MSEQWTITISPKAAPAAIASSIAATLRAHGFVLCRANDTTFALDDDREAAVLKEMSNNAAMALCSLDIEEPVTTKTAAGNVVEWSPAHAHR